VESAIAFAEPFAKLASEREPSWIFQASGDERGVAEHEPIAMQGPCDRHSSP
jgi:hypothetical protein